MSFFGGTHRYLNVSMIVTATAIVSFGVWILDVLSSGFAPSQGMHCPKLFGVEGVRGAQSSVC